MLRSSFSEGVSVQHLVNPKQVGQFYGANGRKLFWFCNTPRSHELRVTLLRQLDSAAYIGVNSSKYPHDQLHKLSEAHPTASDDSNALMRSDILFTDAALSYCKDLYCGDGISRWMRYDEWSGKYAEKRQ